MRVPEGKFAAPEHPTDVAVERPFVESRRREVDVERVDGAPIRAAWRRRGDDRACVEGCLQGLSVEEDWRVADGKDRPIKDRGSRGARGPGWKLAGQPIKRADLPDPGTWWVRRLDGAWARAWRVPPRRGLG